MSKQKLFILGVGAQKGGTTWWARECRRLGVFFPFGKEGHVWTSVEESNLNPKSIPLWAGKKEVVRQRIWSSVIKPEQYFEISDAIFTARNCPIADITPIYCSLGQVTFARIREGLIRKGFTVRVLFFARDPLSRAWSMHRMGIKQYLRNHPEDKAALSAECAYESFSQNYLRSYQQLRTRYEVILPKLFNVFEPDEVGVFFYENLFCVDTYDSICRFLGLAPACASFADVRNASPVIGELPLNLKSIVVEGYRETYEYMRQAYPIVNDLWRDSYSLLQ